MPSVIKVDQIQSDTGTVNLTSNVAFSGSASTMQIGNALYLANTNNFALQFQPDVAGRFRIASSVSSFGDNNPFLIERPSSVGIQNDAITIRSGGVVDLGKGQLKFPASQNASTDPNTLDDYEEGTWTVAWSSGVNSPGYSDTGGTYVKIGRLVTISGRIQTTSGSGNSNQLQIGGLPFAYDTGTRQGGCVLNYNGGFLVNGELTLHVASGPSIFFFNTDGTQMLGNETNNIAATLHFNGFYYTT